MKCIATFLLAFAAALLTIPDAQAQFTRTDYPTGAKSIQIAIADINGDGNDDLAIANNGSSTVTILLGDGSGNFSEASYSPIDSINTPVGVTAADFDGDTDVDLAVTNDVPGTVTILLNNSTDGFSATTVPNSEVGDTPDGIVSGDFDTDGDVDLVFTNRGPGMVTVLQNDGSAGFTRADRIPVGSRPRFPVAGDFDGDGALDLAVPNRASATVSVLENTSTSGAISFSVAVTVDVGKGPSALAAADFDGDGALDLAVTNSMHGTVSILGNRGAFNFNATTESLNGEGDTFGIAAASLDNDAGMDLAVTNLDMDQVMFLLNDGSGDFNLYGTPQPVGGMPAIIAGADFDGNGRTDLAMANYGSGNATVLLSTSPLPIELVSFEAVVDGDAVVLSWRTASETGNKGFKIQCADAAGEARQETSLQWETLASVEGEGTTTEVQQYRYRVENMEPGAYRFRLQQVDIDGTASYSDVVEVRVALAKAYRLTEAAPNPFTSRAHFTLRLREAQDVRIEVYDLLGRKVAVLHEGRLAAGGTHRFAIDGQGLSSGIYLIRVAGEQFAEVRKVTFVR